MPGYEVLRGWRAAPIWDELKSCTGVGLQIKPTKMGCAADTHRGSRSLLRAAFQPCDQVAEILRCQVVSTDDPKWCVRNERDGLEASQQVVLQWVDRSGANVTCPLAEAECVAVRLRARDTAGPDAASRTSDVFDDNWLSQRTLEMIGKNSRQNVGWASSREWHDHRDWSFGVI